MLGSLSVLTLAVAVWRPTFTTRNPPPSSEPLNWKKRDPFLLPEASEPIDRARRKKKPFLRMSSTKSRYDAGGHEYVVSTGDTLSSILNQYGIDMGDIAQPIKSCAT